MRLHQERIGAEWRYTKVSDQYEEVFWGTHIERTKDKPTAKQIMWRKEERMGQEERAD